MPEDYGRGLLRQFWYECDVCGTLVPESKTTRHVLTQRQKGLRVCYVCLDQPGTEDYHVEAANRLARASNSENEVKPP
jgi:hypothetical protein